MRSLRSRLAGRKQKDADTPDADLLGVPTDPTTPSPSSSVSNASAHVGEPKRGLKASFRHLLGAEKPSNKKQPPVIVVEDNGPAQNNVISDDTEPPMQTEHLLSKRLNVDLTEDPNYQGKLDAIDYSIEVLGLFDELAKVIALVVPDALGLALEKITAILQRLKKMIENKQAWKDLLISIDDRQRMFNEQLVGVQAHELPPKLVGAMKQYAESLEKLAARVMEQAGVVQKGSPKDGRLVRIKTFMNRLLNADSDAEDISGYKAELTVVVDSVQTALAIYTAVTVNRIDRKADNLKALIFLEGSSSASDRIPLGTKHKSCLKDTRVDVLEDIRRWNGADGVSEKPVYCIGDVAGTGKSTIAHTLAEEWGVGQYFAFFFSDTSTQEARTLCISFAKQIIGSCHGPNWDEYWANLSSDLSSPISQSVENLWAKLVSDPLGKCMQHKRHVLIVDALDECDKVTRGPLLKCLLESCSQPRLRLLLTTRKEDDICDILELESYRDTVLHRSLLDSVTSQADIMRYVEHRLNKGKSVQLTVAQREQLVKRCDGLFIFASLACGLLEREYPKDQPLLLQEMLEGFTSLDVLYHRTLSQAEDSKRMRERLKSILRVILVAQEPLSIASIAALLSESADDVRMLIKRLGSILGSSAVDQPVYILHVTLKEFLLRPAWVQTKRDSKSGFEKEKERQNQYYISEPESHRTVLKGCLSNIMANELKFNICRLETSFLLNEKFEDMDDRINRYISDVLQYSCVHWASHLESIAFDAEVFCYLQYFMDNQFLPWLEVLSVTKRAGFASRLLLLLIKWMQIHHRDDAMARDMHKFVATFSEIISQSASHIYLSALPFAPRDSPVSKCYRKLYPQTLSIQTGGYSDWPQIQNVLWGHTGDINSIAFSPDGQRIVSGSRDKTVRVWDATTGEAVGRPFEGHTRAVNSIAFSPDGQRIVSGSEDMTVRVWDAATGEAVGRPFEGHTNYVYSVAFSPDGQRIVSGSRDKTVRVWDAATGEAVGRPFEGHTSDVSSVAFSPDGQRIVSGSYDRTVRVWDAATGEAVGRTFEGHTNYVSSVAFSPDGQRIVSGSYDRTVRVWDAATGEAVGRPFQGHTRAVSSVAFSPDGQRIVSGSYDETVRVWDAATGEAVGRPFEGHTHAVSSVAFSPDGQRIVSGSYDRTVRVWDAATGEAVGRPFEGHTAEVYSVAFSPDGQRIVSGSRDKTVRVWDATTGEAVGRPFEGHTAEVYSVAFSPDGQRIVSGSYDRTVRVWDAATGEAVGRPFQGHTYAVNSVAFSPDGQRIVSGSYDETVRVWDAATGEAVGRPFEGHTHAVNSVAFSPDGQRIVSGSHDRTVRVWDAATGEAVGRPFEGHTYAVSSVAFSPNGQRIVSGSYDRTVRVWDAATGEAVGRPFEGHTHAVNSVAFSPDGQRIVSGSYNRTVRVWDAATGEAVGRPFEGHTHAVNSVAFSPDGQRIVSGSHDKTVRVWDAATGEAVGRPFEGHTARVSSVAFSSDGKHIASGSDGSTVRVLNATKSESNFLLPGSKLVNGWVVDSNSKLLVWVPMQFRDGLLRGGAVLILGRFVKTTPDLTSFVYGESWGDCKG